ncbi:MAG: dephospho-CoA kinase [Woeseiaceae bacterium]|jgi:dephospho-CoA kinase|tara:strand:+ start:2836 stop:3543 length:708 start_codon:yes stop_codon:yes gene_type:complete
MDFDDFWCKDNNYIFIYLRKRRISINKKDESINFQVALTGGIASGKSKVSEIFRNLSVDIIDTDDIAHYLVKPGSETLEMIIKKFSKGILTDSGELDRQYMRKLIFNDPTKRQCLESIMHPQIHKEVKIKLSKSLGPYQIIVVPLLTTSPIKHQANKILVIDCDEQTQIKRLMTRDSVSLGMAKKIIASQAKREERLLIADDIIENNNDFMKLIPTIKKIHKKYLEYALIYHEER